MARSIAFSAPARIPMIKSPYRSRVSPPRGNLTAQVLRDLTLRIERGDLSPGDRLPPERRLMEDYRVSRTVVREAISSLRASGRIETQQGRGAFVLAAPVSLPYTIDPAEASRLGDVLQIMDLRIGLETEAAALAAQRRTTTQLAGIREALDRLEADIRSAETAVESDIRFHQEIIHATGNHYLRSLFAQLAPLLIPRARVDLFKRDRKAKVQYLQRIQQEHAQIYDAIARRDAEAARAAVRLHLSNSRERLRMAMELSRGKLRAT
jgi:DNA-binding FadR family transcriptional regulator